MEAEEVLRRGLESRPDDPDLQFLVAENLRLQGKTKAASAAWTRFSGTIPIIPSRFCARPNC